MMIPKAINRSSTFLIASFTILTLVTLCEAVQYQVSVTAPVYGGTISGNTNIIFSAPGMTSATVKCWKPDAAYGHDSIFPGITLSSDNG
jgi:hypothetical protein